MRTPTLLILIACALPAFAAGTGLESENGVYYLHLAGPDSFCEIETLGDTEVLEASCVAKGYKVLATDAWGCGDSYGPTYCGSVDPGPHPPVANELLCPDGERYILQAGTGVVRCKREGDTKWCVSEDRSHSAEASCASGCKASEGAGVCCVPGTGDCPKGIDDESDS